MWHSGGYDKWNENEIPKENFPSDGSGWIGIKHITYNMIRNGNLSVTIETYVDRNNKNNWVLVQQTIDGYPNFFGNEGTYCKGDPNQLISWGGPLATFRWDDGRDVDIKKMSVRQIEVYVFSFRID